MDNIIAISTFEYSYKHGVELYFNTGNSIFISEHEIESYLLKYPILNIFYKEILVNNIKRYILRKTINKNDFMVKESIGNILYIKKDCVDKFSELFLHKNHLNILNL